MTRQIPMDQPLSEEDRAYLLMRGEDARVAYLDQQYPAEEDAEPTVDPSQLPDDYNKWPKAELEAEAKARNIEVTGTGKNGAVLVSDLVKALEDDDAKQS